ncbi:MAG: single-stranded DNA-binding protein [Sulfobacillus sp.]
MSQDLNQCNFIGRLGKDPESRSLPDGKTVVNFSIACGQSWKDKSGEKQEKTEWVRIVVFGKLADICAEYLKKGQQVYLSGRMQTRKWEDKEGKEKYTTEIIADHMQMLGGKRDATAETEKPVEKKAAADDDWDDDSIPF